MIISQKPDLSRHLLWEYDFEKFDFKKSYRIIIERVLERGNLKDWTEMKNFYTDEQILTTINWSKQLKERDKSFAKLFIKSNYFDVSRR